MKYYYIIPAIGIALAYGYMFFYRGRIKKADGNDAYARAQLDKLFQLPEGESVTAAWEAVTIPKLDKRQKTIEALSLVRYMEWGWEEGAILRLDIPGEEPLEINIRASAVPVLLGWSRGNDVSRLTGPFPLT